VLLAGMILFAGSPVAAGVPGPEARVLAHGVVGRCDGAAAERVIPPPSPSSVPATTPDAGRETPLALGPRSGRASWYDDGPGLYAAVNSFRWGDTPYRVRVTAGDRSVVVIVRDFCGCYTGTARERIIDLSPAAFQALAPLSRGLVHVTVDILR